MRHLGLFEGIGGFSLAARWMQWETVAWCEWNPFCQTVLKHHFPKAQAHGDITATDFTGYAGRIDILTGGFPCQPFSTAGKRKGTADDRHLWPEMLRAIREIQPRYVVGENVGGFVSWDGGMVFEQVQSDLENEGYEVQAFMVPACAVDAPHRRDRVWIVAHAKGVSRNDGTRNAGHRTQKIPSKRPVKPFTSTHPQHDGCATAEIGQGARAGNDSEQAGAQTVCEHSGCSCKAAASTANTKGKQGERVQFEQRELSEQKQGEFGGGNCKDGVPGWEGFPTQSPVCCRNDGISAGLVGITVPKHRNESIKGYGNAIVPQIAFEIFKAIQETDKA